MRICKRKSKNRGKQMVNMANNYSENIIYQPFTNTLKKYKIRFFKKFG